MLKQEFEQLKIHDTVIVTGKNKFTDMKGIVVKKDWPEVPTSTDVTIAIRNHGEQTFVYKNLKKEN